MKIAIPYEYGQVFQHFGRSAQFKIYDAENGLILSSEVVSTNGQGHCNLVRRTEKGRLRRRGWGLRWEKAQKGGKGTNLRGFFED